jgi:hypothetical protein
MTRFVAELMEDGMSHKAACDEYNSLVQMVKNKEVDIVNHLADEYGLDESYSDCFL